MANGGTRNSANTAVITKMVTEGKMSRKQAAELLGASIRTIHNYVKRYEVNGWDGLIDHRGGNHRKLSDQTIQQIIACKLQKPKRSARWLRDHLKLNVSVEAVRQVLIKHYPNRDNGKHSVNVPKTPFDRPQILTPEGSAMINAASTIKINEHVIFQELDGEAVLLNMNTEVYFGLDKTGTHIWNLLHNHGTMTSLIGALMQDYEIEEKELQKHLVEFIEKLHAKGLIEIEKD